MVMELKKQKTKKARTSRNLDAYEKQKMLTDLHPTMDLHINASMEMIEYAQTPRGLSNSR